MITDDVYAPGRRAPLTKAARQNKIAELVSRGTVHSQTDLREQLAGSGVVVTQGTLSKDLVELGALRVRDAHGHLVYAVPGEGGDRSPVAGESATSDARLGRLCGEVLVSAEASANLVVVRTPPGAAQYFASALDRVSWHAVLGTIAGDDTIMIITREPDGGHHVADRLLALTTEVRGRLDDSDGGLR